MTPLKAIREKCVNGQKFNQLTIVSTFYKDIGTRKRLYCKCLCDCGNEKEIDYDSVVSGHTKSCGCLQKQKCYKHGGYGSRLYRTWVNMRYRCNSVDGKIGRYYGAKGISVCDEWSDFSIFREWALSNGYCDELTIDRINYNGNYEPSNCRWITNAEQQSNRGNVKMITRNGETKCVSAWANEYGISPTMLHGRIYHGWDIDQALTTPKIRSL